jgi:Coenzyme PQQ synthesis protein D (PqqD)
MLQLRTDGLSWKQIDDEVVVLDGRGGTYLAINGSGSLLWLSLWQGATREELAHVLVDAFGIEPSRATADVDGFLGTLENQGLLVA